MWLVSTIVVAIVVLCGGSIIWYTLRTGISPMPSSRKARKTMHRLMPSRMVGTIYELGSGWGGVAIAMAKKYPEHKVIGYELSPLPLALARARARIGGYRNLAFRQADYMTADLRDAGLVVCYLFPEGMKALSEKFTRELPDGTTVVSNTFRLPGWQPDETVTVPDIYKTPIYRYQLIRQH